MTSYVDLENTLNRYLYGEAERPEKPEDRLQEFSDPTANPPLVVDVDAVSYMASVGRFASLADAQIVRDFFEGALDPLMNLGVTDANGVTRLSLNDFYSGPNPPASAKFVIAQYLAGTTEPDYQERAFIWGLTSFVLARQTTFVWDATGNRTVVNGSILPYNTDFDFNSGWWVAEAVNKNYLEPNIDPYGIGNLVEFNMTASSKDALNTAAIGSVFTQSQFDLYSAPGYIFGSEGNAALAIISLASAVLNGSGLKDKILTTHNSEYTYLGRDVIYGSSNDDNLSYSSHKDSWSGSDPTTSGAYFVSGGGTDTIVGGDRADIAFGGAGNDTFIASDGDDEYWGGGSDPLFIDADNDTVNYSFRLEPVFVKFDGTAKMEVVKPSGTDKLHYVEHIIGSTLDDNFKFSGEIPEGINLSIDGGGGAHDKIDLAEAADLAGLKLQITDESSGAGFIQSRSGAGGAIYVKNFHTDITGSDYSDAITDESDGSHVIDAGAGDDIIRVSGLGAMIDGGAGNDVIHLKSASATIKFGAGGGHDVVEFDDGDGDYNLALQGLSRDDVELIAGGRNVYGSPNWNPLENSNGFHDQFLAVRIKSTGETITFLENGRNIGPDGNGSAISYYSNELTQENGRRLKSISFSDGIIENIETGYGLGGYGVAASYDYWSYSNEINSHQISVPGSVFTSARSYLDHINATYLQAAPIGAPPPPPDETPPTTPGNDDVRPGFGNDTVEGSAGNDLVRESRGNDTYKWNIGDGDDIIGGSGALDGSNTLELGAGILPTDLQFAVSDDGAGLTLTFVGQTGSVTLSSALVGDGFGVDQIRFADDTIMSRADLIAAASTEIAAAQTTINGTGSADFIFAPAGNFIVNPGGDDDDISVNGPGSGKYLFSSADGHDQIYDLGFGYSRNDTLELTDATAADITLSRSGDSLIVTLTSTGATVNVTAQFKEDDGEIHGINTLKFSDNTTWTRLQIRDAALGTESGTAPIAETAIASVVEDAAIIRGTLGATDADDGDVLTFSLDDQIAGLVLAANGSWSFDASNAAYQNLSQGEESVLTANYHVTDSAGLTSVSTLTLTLTGTSTMPLVEQELVNQRLADNAAFAYDVTSSFSDPEGDILAFTAVLDDGSELPAWLTFEDGQFEGTAPTGTSGVLNVVVTASNGAMETSSPFRLHFGPDNVAPTASTPLPNIIGGVDDPIDISVAPFVDPEGDPVTVLSATLADDSPLPSWLSFEDGHLTGTPPVAAFGNAYDIKITATDGEDEGSTQFSLTIGRRIVTGTLGDDEFDLTSFFDATGGTGSDYYKVTGNGEGVFYYSRGDGWDAVDSLDDGVRTDKLIFTDINSDEVTVYRYGDSADLFIDDYNDFWAGYQFSGDNPGGVNQGLDQVQFADSVSWNRDEIRNRANAPEIVLDSSGPSQVGSSISEAFVMESGLGAGTIDDFEVIGSSHDYLQFDRSQFDTWAHLLGATTQQGSDLVIDLGGSDSVTLTDVSLSAFTSLNVRFVDWDLF